MMKMKGMIVAQTNITILYVEDDKDIREGLIPVLKYISNQLYVAVDGKDGLEQFKKYNPTIIISDIKMPNMTGLEMVKEIRKINKKQHIIFTTAHSESSYFMEAIEAHVDGYILKPIDLDILEDKLYEIIEYTNLKEKYEQQKIQIMQNEKMASMSELIKNIAHQWRQPLSSISTASSGILLYQEIGQLTDDILKQSCDSITNNAQYISKIIDSFSEYMQDDPKTQRFNLCEDINTFLNIIELDIKENKIKLILDLDKDIIIDGYPNQINQCMLNIFNNSKDAYFNIDEERLFFITTKKNINSIIITLKDNAGGIDDSIIHKIFEPYFTTKHQSQGTGLGLHMTYNIIKNMGWEIEIFNDVYQFENSKYKGTVCNLKYSF